MYMYNFDKIRLQENSSLCIFRLLNHDISAGKDVKLLSEVFYKICPDKTGRL